MTPEQMTLLCACLLGISFLYSSVGHAGATGYLAVMGILSVAPDTMRPVALILNVLVASVTSWQFYRAGHFRWASFWPFALLSVPAAFVGGYVSVPAAAFKLAVGVILLFSAIVLMARLKADDRSIQPPTGVSLGVGAGLGFVAGLTGTGGGVFLTPLLILCRWAPTKTASATSALFILVNSISGLGGLVTSGKELPSASTMIPLLSTVLVGGSAGSYYGSRRFSRQTVRLFLSGVLVIAAAKLLLL